MAGNAGLLRVLWATMALVAPGDGARAQDVAPAPVPAPAASNLTIASSCSDLRRATDDLTADQERTLELSVIGSLTMVEFDGTLAYLAVCQPPDPQVLCIAYGTNGLNVGDRVVLSGGLGGYARPDADHVLLDPCLPSLPEP